MSKSAEVPFISPSTHIPPVLTPPPRYSPGKNPRFLYLYNRKFLVLISLLLFLIAITLIVGFTLICLPRIYGSKEFEKSKSDVSEARPERPKQPSDQRTNTPHNPRVPDPSDDDNRPLIQKMEPQQLGPPETMEQEAISSIQRDFPIQENTLSPQEGNDLNVETPQSTEEVRNQADKRRLVLRVEHQKLEAPQQQTEETMPTVPVRPLVQEATLPSHQVKPQYVQPPQHAQELVKPTSQRIEATVKPFIPPRERNIIPCNETCTNGGAVASCCGAHGMSDGICDERDRAICWNDQ